MQHVVKCELFLKSCISYRVKPYSLYRSSNTRIQKEQYDCPLPQFSSQCDRCINCYHASAGRNCTRFQLRPLVRFHLPHLPSLRLSHGIGIELGNLFMHKYEFGINHNRRGVPEKRLDELPRHVRGWRLHLFLVEFSGYKY